MADAMIVGNHGIRRKNRNHSHEGKSNLNHIFKYCGVEIGTFKIYQLCSIGNQFMYFVKRIIRKIDMNLMLCLINVSKTHSQFLHVISVTNFVDIVDTARNMGSFRSYNTKNGIYSDERCMKLIKHSARIAFRM